MSERSKQISRYNYLKSKFKDNKISDSELNELNGLKLLLGREDNFTREESSGNPEPTPRPKEAGEEENPDRYICENCGNVLIPGCAFCPSCGKPLDWGEEEW